MSNTPDRAQVEPIPALVALLAVAAGVTAFVGTIHGLEATTEASVAPPTLDSVHDVVVIGGVANADRLEDAQERGPNGYDLAIALNTETESHRRGPTPPPTASTASREVSVAIGPGTIRRGTLRVAVWR